MGQQDKNEEEVEGSWRDTLYIWDGIVTILTKQDTKDDATGNGEDGDNNDESAAGVAIRWDGTWVASQAADAMEAAAPKRNAFAEFVDSDVRFDVEGVGTPCVSDDDDDVQDSAIPPPFIVKLVSGSGWEMNDDGDNKKKESAKKYQDDVHDVLVKSLRWSGNMYDQTENLIVARGHNEFGKFISVGWMRPGNRWTVARRYLPDDDPRSDLTLKQLLDRVVDEVVVTVEHTGQRKIQIPCWQCRIMHSDHTKSSPIVDGADGALGHHSAKAEKRGEKRKADTKDEGEEASEKMLKQ